MKSTVFHEAVDPGLVSISQSVTDSDLPARYAEFESGASLAWSIQYRKLQFVGRGGQGVVFRGERLGADGFVLPIAVKVFSPGVYGYVEDYETDMARIAAVAVKVATIQQDHLLDVHNFVEQDGIRIMVMEWVNGFNLEQLLHPDMLALSRERLDSERFDDLNSVVVTSGPDHSRLKPGIAIQVLRECLTGLGSLHRAGVSHGDVKPSNIMLKRTGNAKIIDIGSAVDLASTNRRRAWTPTYAAPEILEGRPNSPQSDLASLGYVLIEMLAGQSLFSGLTDEAALLDVKRSLPGRLCDVLPEDAVRNETLLHLCEQLIDIDPQKRVASAEEANLEQAAPFHRELVHSGLDSDYENDLRVWIESLPDEPETSRKPVAPPAPVPQPA